MLGTMNRVARLIRASGSTPFDAAAALLLLGAAVALAARTTDPMPYGMVAAALAVAWRRRFPTAVCAAVGLGLTAAFLRPLSEPLLLTAAVCLILACYAGAVHARIPWAGPALLLAVVTPFAGGSPLAVPPVVIPFLIVGSAWLAGAAVRARAGRMSAWRAEAARERDRSSAAAVREERARIARELHDVVSHRVSVMVIAAGAARMLLPGEPGGAVEQLRLVEAGGREALADLRGMLGLLTTVPDGAEVHPQPGLAMLPSLVSGVRAAGLPVTCDVAGPPRLPPGLDLAAYRIVQEALTNSLRHSTRSGTRVTVEVDDGTLALDIVDGEPAPVTRPRAAAAGRGLVGIRERAASYGGTVRIDDDPARPFALAVRLPIPPDTDDAS
jgi:signal transduction histidine kinase